MLKRTANPESRLRMKGGREYLLVNHCIFGAITRESLVRS